MCPELPRINLPVRILNVQGTKKLYNGNTLGTITELEDPEILCSLSDTFNESSGSPNNTTVQLDIDQFDWSGTDLNKEQRDQLISLLSKYSDVFSSGHHDLGRTTVTRNEIPTGETRPIRQRPYRQPYHVREDMERQISGMLDTSN